MDEEDKYSSILHRPTITSLHDKPAPLQKQESGNEKVELSSSDNMHDATEHVVFTEPNSGVDESILHITTNTPVNDDIEKTSENLAGTTSSTTEEESIKDREDYNSTEVASGTMDDDIQYQEVQQQPTPLAASSDLHLSTKAFIFSQTTKKLYAICCSAGSRHNGNYILCSCRDSFLCNFAIPAWQKVSCANAITGVVEAATTSFFERMIFHEPCGIFIGKKLIQICDAFSAYRYALPDMADAPAVARLFQKTAQELVDLKTVLPKIYDTWYRLCQLHTISVAKRTWTVLQEKEVYHTVNTFQADVSRLIHGIDWIIAESVDAVIEEVTLSMEDHLCLNFFERHDEKVYCSRPIPSKIYL